MTTLHSTSNYLFQLAMSPIRSFCYCPYILAALGLLLGNVTSATSREWNTLNGEFSVEAEFIRFKDGKVYLEKKDGSVVSVAVKKFSYADCDYLRELSKNDRDLQNFFRLNVIPTAGTVRMVEIADVCRFMDFSPKGNLLAVVSHEGLEIIDVSTGKIVGRMVENGFDKYLDFCKFTPDGDELICGRMTGQIKIWKIDEGAKISLAREYQGHKRKVSSMTFSPDGKYVLSGDENKSLRYWNLESCQDSHVFEEDFTGYVTACYVNPKGTQALGTDSKFVILYDLRTGKAVQKMPMNRWDGKPAAFMPDGSIVAGVDTGSVRFWETVSGKQGREIKFSITCSSLAFSPDGEYLLVGTYKTIQLWKVKTATLLHEYRTISDTVSLRKLAWSTDSKLFSTNDRVNAKYMVQVFRLPPSE